MLPANFHQRVVDLEIKVESRPIGSGNQDETKTVQDISELMGLYSVSFSLSNPQHRPLSSTTIVKRKKTNKAIT